MKDQIINVGRTDSNCTVHWIKSLGYWVCPSHIQLYVDVNDEVHATAIHHGQRRSRRLKVNDVVGGKITKQDLDGLVRPLLDFIYPHVYLCRYRGYWPEYPERLITECTAKNSRCEIYLQVPLALHYENETIRIGCFAAGDAHERSVLYDKALLRAKALVEEFKTAYKVSHDDIFTFQEDNPATRENRQARR